MDWVDVVCGWMAIAHVLGKALSDGRVRVLAVAERRAGDSRTCAPRNVVTRMEMAQWGGEQRRCGCKGVGERESGKEGLGLVCAGHRLQASVVRAGMLH
jgi:hypothetical protein